MESDKIFFAPSNKFSIKKSEFAGMRTATGLSTMHYIYIAIRNTQTGYSEISSESRHSGMFSYGSSSSHSKDVRELEVLYYDTSESKKDLEALKEFLQTP